MQTFGEIHHVCNRKGQQCSYWGEHGDWLVVAGQHRDSDSVERSNFRSILRKMGGESAMVAIERESHWAVGWVEHLLIDPADADRVSMGEELRAGLADYPVVDESDWSELEWEDLWAWAESALSGLAGWETALRGTLDNGNYFIGDQCSEWEAIEATRKVLEDRG